MRAHTSANKSSPRRPARPLGFGGKLARWFTGSWAAGALVLTVVVLLAELMAADDGTRGPGAVVITGHALAAGLAVGAAAVADRSRGVVAAVAMLGSLAIVGVMLWAFWLA